MLRRKKFTAAAGAVVAVGAAAIGLSISSAAPSGSGLPQSASPIKHVVVLFDENISFDHYFGTYPFATNPAGEPQFHAAPGTPSVNGLNNTLLTANPNLDEPERLGRTQAVTCDQNHGYSAEQASYDQGLMDKFVQDVTGSGCSQATYPDQSNYGPNGIDMDYYDGNTVTALWNYAQHYTLSDNSYNTQFGPSTPGAINLVSGQTNGAVVHGGTSGNVANNTLIGDAEPFYDQCSNASTALNSNGTPGGVTASFTGKNIGDLMNSSGVSWGWFQGGFTPSAVTAGRAICGTQHTNIADASQNDYVEHHEPFQYYASTSNPDHVSPSSVSKVGLSDPAGTPAGHSVNHQYDLAWFFQSLKNGNLPQVSFLKPPAYQNGHAGNSDPLDEQKFLVDTINQIEQSPDWSSTAIVIAYDDSDGWYDHVEGPIIRQSQDVADALSGTGRCGSAATPPAQNDKCGVGPRTPLLVISPWAKQNYVDNTFTEQASITQFIENNWNLGHIGSGSADTAAGSLNNAFDFNPRDRRAPAIILNDQTGEVERVVGGSTTPHDDSGSGQQTGSGSQQQGSSGSGSPQQGGSGSGSQQQGGSTGGSAPKGSGTEGSGTKGSGTKGKPRYKPLTVTWRYSVRRHVLTLSGTTKGGSNQPAVIRVRLLQSGKLVHNVASRIRAGHVRFTLKLKRSGRYTVRFSIDVGGKVSAVTHNVRVG